jgi:hypothetical protein
VDLHLSSNQPLVFTIFLAVFGVTFGDEEIPPADCGRSLPEEKKHFE